MREGYILTRRGIGWLRLFFFYTRYGLGRFIPRGTPGSRTSYTCVESGRGFIWPVTPGLRTIVQKDKKRCFNRGCRLNVLKNGVGFPIVSVANLLVCCSNIQLLGHLGIIISNFCTHAESRLYSDLKAE